MRNIYLCLLLCTSPFAFAQKPPAKFGDIPMEDMKMTVYPKDSSSEAVVLFDYGVTYLANRTKALSPSDKNFILQSTETYLYFERHIRIKILKTVGLHHANIEIPLFHVGALEEKLGNLKAVTYNLERDKIIEAELSKEGTFKEKFNRN